MNICTLNRMHCLTGNQCSCSRPGVKCEDTGQPGGLLCCVSSGDVLSDIEHCRNKLAWCSGSVRIIHEGIQAE